MSNLQVLTDECSPRLALGLPKGRKKQESIWVELMNRLPLLQITLTFALVAISAASHAADVGFPLLTALILVPAAGAVLTLLMPAQRPELTRMVGYITSAATFGQPSRGLTMRAPSLLMAAQWGAQKIGVRAMFSMPRNSFAREKNRVGGFIAAALAVDA